ncbi:hypothetical protein LOC51_00710 [Rubrivivax sp. JA1024]|nr:hypothetical protein [Rubrivivax sp. JA1024]
MNSDAPKRATVALELNNPECLHCAVTYAIGLWAKKYSPKIDGKPLVARGDVSIALAIVIADFIGAIPDDPLRAAAQEHARRALDAAFAAREAGATAADPRSTPACASSSVSAVH